MANVKITELTALTSPETTDVLPIVDVDTDVTKKVSVGEIVGKISGDVTVGTDGTAAITGGVIVNADVNASAAIAGTKIDPDFGSQTVETTGVINAGSGTEGAPAVTVGTADSGLYSPGTDQVAISTNGTGRLFVDASGNVGLGNSSPNAKFEVIGSASNDAIAAHIKAGDSGNTVGLIVDGDNDSGDILIKARSNASATPTDTDTKFIVTGQGNVGIAIPSPEVALHVDGDIRCDGVYGETDINTSIQFPGSDVITFNEGGSEAARIDSSGRLLVGTSTSSSYGNATGLLQIVGTTDAHIALKRTTDNSAQGTFTFAKSRGTVGSETIVNNEDTLGSIRFAGYDGVDYNTNAAEITCAVDGTPGADDMRGRLVFSTNGGSPDTSPTERMRIGNDGNVYIGKTTTTVDLDGLAFVSDGQLRTSVTDTNNAWINRNGTDGAVISFRKSNSTVGSISITTSATAYNTSSDYRLKENVVPLTGAADRLNQLQVHRFNFIADPDTTVDGFLAHEAQAVVPECVTGTKDEVDDEGNPVYQGIDQSKIVPLVVAALQEALAEIETLKARLADAGIS